MEFDVTLYNGEGIVMMPSPLYNAWVSILFFLMIW